MAVKSTPVLKEEIDYAEMCQRLQAKVLSFYINIRSHIDFEMNHLVD